METIDIGDAEARFEELVERAERGEEFAIVRDGKPVARILPVNQTRVLTPEQVAAWKRTQARMEKGWALGGDQLERDALYDR